MEGTVKIAEPMKILRKLSNFVEKIPKKVFLCRDGVIQARDLTGFCDYTVFGLKIGYLHGYVYFIRCVAHSGSLL